MKRGLKGSQRASWIGLMLGVEETSPMKRGLKVPLSLTPEVQLFHAYSRDSGVGQSRIVPKL
jgi:hypothetical protein